MTHFIGLVCVKGRILGAKVESEIARLLHPYCESTEVEPYLSKSKEEVIIDMGDYYKDNKDTPWPSLMKQWNGCEVDKDGNAMSTFNPNSFYDWFQVGGRWDGELGGTNIVKAEDIFPSIKKQITELKLMNKARDIIAKELDPTIKANGLFGSYGFADIFRKFFGVEENSGLTKKEHKLYDDILKKLSEQTKQIRMWNGKEFKVYGTIVESDGTLHKGMDWGWFGCSDQIVTDDEWFDEYLDVLERAAQRGDKVVVVDFHV